MVQQQLQKCHDGLHSSFLNSLPFQTAVVTGALQLIRWMPTVKVVAVGCHTASFPLPPRAFSHSSTLYVPCWLLHLHQKAHWSQCIMIWLWTSWPSRHYIPLVISRKVLYRHSDFPDLFFCKYLSVFGSITCMWLLPVALKTSRISLFHFGFALHWQKSPPSHHLLISDPSKLSYITLVFTQFEEHKHLLATRMKWFTFIVFVHVR